MNIKDWYSGLAKREQNIVTLAGIVLVIGLVFQLVIGPINDSAAKAERDLLNKQKLLTWVEENSAKINAAKSNNKQSNQSLTQIVNRSARQFKIKISGTRPQGQDLQVQLDNIEFNALLKWLDDLVYQQGLSITMLDVTGSDNPGEVKVRRLQLAK